MKLKKNDREGAQADMAAAAAIQANDRRRVGELWH
jgi:hypothetical protein